MAGEHHQDPSMYGFLVVDDAEVRWCEISFVQLVERKWKGVECRGPVGVCAAVGLSTLQFQRRQPKSQ